MVQILPEVPSFGTQFARSIGSGLSAGISKGADLATQMALEKYKQKQRQKLIGEIEGTGSQGTAKELQGQPQEDIRQKFLEALPQIEQAVGRELSPQDLDMLWNKMSQQQPQQQVAQQQAQESDPFLKAKKYAAAGEHELARLATEEAKRSGKESFAREQAGEPKLQEIGDKLEAYEQSGLRFDRLNQLFSPELENAFPPAIFAGAFTKDGELRPTAQATLSPEAQEALKLVTDEIRGAKDTFGARVTNFDASTYLKTLPGLLNTAEGRRRVLRDLRIINQLNQMHSRGVLDIVDRYGGPGKISITKANMLYKKENAKKIKEMRQAFVKPDSFPFTQLDEFNASLFPGVTIEDPETGQTFSSNGETWEPQ